MKLCLYLVILVSITICLFNKIQYNKSSIFIKGEILSIKYSSFKKKYIIKNNGLYLKNIEKIRFNSNQSFNVGDVISFKANLIPPPRPLIPGSYDFTFANYSKQIGAIAIPTSPIKIIKKGEPRLIDDLRNKITNRVYEQTGNSIAPALITGRRDFIEPVLMDKIRRAGLAHILAISGLHLGLISGFVFFITRFFCSLSQKFSSRFDSGKLASVNAIIISFGYLLIAGAPLSARRAFIMSTIFFLSIIFARKVSLLRLIAISAVVILALNPFDLFSASFQMSFAAVTALALFMPPLIKRCEVSHSSCLVKIFKTTCLASIVATIATMPFVLYHFGSVSLYGIFANVIAVPLTTFIIMPFGFISVISMPLGLDALPLNIMDFAINILVSISDRSLQFPTLNFNPIFLAPFFIVAAALYFEQKRFYYLLVLFPLLLINKNHSADLSILDSNKIIIAKDGEELIIPDRRISDYTQNILDRKINYSKFDQKKYLGKNLQCHNKICFFNKNDKSAAIIYKKISLSEFRRYCGLDIVVDLGDNRTNCTKAFVISNWDVKNHGSFFVYFNKNIVVKTIDNFRAFWVI